jgi:HEAT repeat protein
MSNDKRMESRDVKRRVLVLLKKSNFNKNLDELLSLQPKKSINALISFLCHNDLEIRHRASYALGHLVGLMAMQEREQARIIMRRLLWMLNDESGGIGWGVPEAMAEIMACDDQLAKEYSHMLISYLDQQGNFLEYEPLQRGLLWAVGRVAETRPELFESAVVHLPKYLQSEDAAVRGLAAKAVGILEVKAAKPLLEALVDDPTKITLYKDDRLIDFSVGELALESLAKLN